MKELPLPVKIFLLAVWGASLYYASTSALKMRFQPDPMAFMPPESPEASAIKEIQEDFGFGDTGIVLITFPHPVGREEILLEREITRFISRYPGVLRVMSLDDIPRPIVRASELEVYEYTQLLVDGTETPSQFQEAVRSDSNIYGNFVSKDLKTLSVYVSFEKNAVPDSAHDLAAELREKFGEKVDFHFTGSPFLLYFLSDELQKTFKISLPVATLFFFISFFAVKMTAFSIYTVLALGTAILWTLGFMSHFTLKLDFVTGAIPSILFAAGASYVAHILIKGFRKTLTPVLLSAFTTAAGFAAIVVLGIPPLTTFGLVTAVGVIFVALAAFIITMLFRRESPEEKIIVLLGRPVFYLTEAAAGAPVPALGLTVIITLVGLIRILSAPVDVSMASLFAEGSSVRQHVEESEKILPGGDFFFLLVRAPYNDPAVLRAVDEFELAARHDNCAYWSQSPAQVIKQSAGYLAGIPRIPLNEGKFGEILFLVEPEQGFQQMVTEKGKFIAMLRTASQRWRECNDINTDLARQIFKKRWLLTEATEPSEDEIKYLARVLSFYGDVAEPDVKAVVNRFPSYLLPQQLAERIRHRLREWGFDSLPPEKLEKLLSFARSDGVLDKKGVLAALSDSLSVRAALEIVLEARAEARAAALGLSGIKDVVGYLLDLEDGLTLKKGKKPVEHVLTGSNTAFMEVDKAVKRGQILATLLTFVLVFLCVALISEERRLAYLCAGAFSPLIAVVVSLAAVTYITRTFDVGTAMASSALLGMGADFALHFVWSLREKGVQGAIEEEAPAQFFSILLTTAGFAPLLTSQITAMANFASVMIIGSLCASLFSMGLISAVHVLLKGNVPPLSHNSDTE